MRSPNARLQFAYWPTLAQEGNTPDISTPEEDYGEAADDFEEDNDDREVSNV